MQVSVGIGLTNDCDLDCAHCYRPQGRIYQLSLDDVRAICERLDVASFNMGTGENWLHPQFPDIVAYLVERGIKMSMASNGYSLNTLPDEILSAFHDVEVSVDYATEREQDLDRGRAQQQKLPRWLTVVDTFVDQPAQDLEQPRCPLDLIDDQQIRTQDPIDPETGGSLYFLGLQ